MAREVLFELGKMITDRLPYKFGIKKLTEDDPEYIQLDRSLESDEQAEIMLKMGLRKPKTLDEIAEITGMIQSTLKNCWRRPHVPAQWNITVRIRIM